MIRTPAHVRALLILLIALVFPVAAAAHQDEDDRCAMATPDPALACPADPHTASLIAWVMAVPEGVSISLTEDGIAHGRSCDGAAELVELASGLYAALPADVRTREDLLWANPMLTREVVAHTWAATLGLDRGNPINVVFSDYTGDADSFQSRVYDNSIFTALCPG